MQTANPFFEGTDAALQQAATGTESFMRTLGMATKKTLNGGAVIVGDAVQGVGATLGAVPSGAYHITKDLEHAGIVGKLLTFLLGSSSSSTRKIIPKIPKKIKIIPKIRKSQMGNGRRRKLARLARQQALARRIKTPLRGGRGRGRDSSLSARKRKFLRAQDIDGQVSSSAARKLKFLRGKGIGRRVDSSSS